MFSPSKLRINTKLFKKLLDLRSCYELSKIRYSDDIPEILKFYSDTPASCQLDKYPKLTEDDYTRFITKKAMKREPADTRQITKLAYKLGKQVISLAEGMPNEEMFPFARLQLSTKTGKDLVLEGSELAAALQYMPSQGYPALLTELRSLQRALHRAPDTHDVLVTNGAQHAIYQCADMLVEPGDPVLLSEYTYTGALSVLRPYDPELILIAEDESGIVPETLESVLESRLMRGLKMPKLLYVVPTGSNPTGLVIPEHRKKQIYELACRYDFLILEDDPYMFFNYTGIRTPSFLSMDVCGRVLRLDSASKAFSAGLRLGWLTAPAPLVARAELHSQAELLHPSTLSQAIILRVLSDRAALAEHAARARDFYLARRDALGEALQVLRGLADWTPPQAGMFYWLRVHGVDDVYDMVFHRALSRGLLLVPGQAFMFDSAQRCSHLRLTFSKLPLHLMAEAALQLRDVILEEHKVAEPRRRAAAPPRSR
ncbi:Kynurenine/alpha-aminoadipate aminotransferase, mitochondrial [Papilio xuthus]|uniref:Kynurenine/alpha-aminoadipate aminotransferase, mitochondrial n=1 Tax=Papilio xuthus TaxID=66420 RepID=A0A194PZ24_PAPXU|nr:Kynurenine/alpha-aminoadipate aminotransferase, mitochondrial [Papilio xuthus]